MGLKKQILSLLPQNEDIKIVASLYPSNDLLTKYKTVQISKYQMKSYFSATILTLQHYMALPKWPVTYGN